jgi:aspartyl aminopeptidase
MLLDAGFEPLTEHSCWTLEAGRSYYVTRNGSSLIAFRVPERTDCGFMIAAAHSDAPTFKLKREPELKDGNYLRLNVEKYGGAIFSPWLDRPLSVAGRVVVQSGERIETRLVNIDRDLVLIPNLAIHMNRQMNDGVALNPQVDMLPLLGLSEAVGTMDDLIARAADVEKEEILDSDLFLYLRESGRLWGAEEEFISSPRLDDLQCAWACTRGLIEAYPPKAVSVCAIFDNEEVGSGTKQGADSTFLQDVLERISVCLGRDSQQHRAALAASLMVSVDNGHAIHPNHPEKADAVNFPKINGGVVIKYSANQKYTTDAVSAGLFRAICKGAGVPVQTYINRSDVLGGSTLGNLSNAHVSLNTVDIGLAQLAMHSPFETGGVKDTAYLLAALRELFQTRLVCEEPGVYQIQS